MSSFKKNNLDKNIKNLRLKKDDFNKDTKAFDYYKEEIKGLSHEIAKNIYFFIIFLTKKKSLLFLIIVIMFIIFPVSKMAVFENSENLTVKMLYQYCNAILEISPPIISFIVSAIVTSWASSKYNKEK